MARKKRIWYPGAQYHIMTRGNRRSDLFEKSEDFIIYLHILSETKLKYPFKLYSYCLMDNHVHLQIRTIDKHISFIMQQINSTYSRYFNDEHNMVGHTFQGRFLAEIIETNTYMLQTNRYIHSNPVKAKMVKYPQDYRWSSYPSYVYNIDENLVDVEEFLLGFRDLEAFIDFTEDSKIYIRDLEIEAIMEEY